MSDARPAEFRHRLALQRRVAIPNERGAQDYEWRFVQWVWASVQPLRSREQWQAQQVQALTTHRIMAFWFPGLTTDEHRFVFDGRILGIESVANIDEACELYEIMAIENKATADDEANRLVMRGGLDA